MKPTDPKLNATARLIISKPPVLTTILFLGEKVGPFSIENINSIVDCFDETTAREMEKCDLVDYNEKSRKLSLTSYGTNLYNIFNKILENSPSEA